MMDSVRGALVFSGNKAKGWFNVLEREKWQRVLIAGASLKSIFATSWHKPSELPGIAS